MWVGSLGREDPQEEGRATLSSVPAWRPHGQRSLGGYSPRGRKESDRLQRLSTRTPDTQTAPSPVASSKGLPKVFRCR